MTQEFVNSQAHYIIQASGTSDIRRILHGRYIVCDYLDLGMLDGFAIVKDGVPVIMINRHLKSLKYEFTLAHEFGHLVLHMVNMEAPRTRFAAACSSLPWHMSSQREHEANLFASHFVLSDQEILDRMRVGANGMALLEELRLGEAVIRARYKDFMKHNRRAVRSIIRAWRGMF